MRRARRLFVYTLVTTILLFTVFLNFTGPDAVPSLLDNPWLTERKYLIQEYSKDRSNVVNLKSACPVPDLNPFSKDVIHLMKTVSGKCKVTKYGNIVDKTFVLEGHIFRDVKLQYIRRAPKKGEISDDFAVTFSEIFDVPKVGKGTFAFSFFFLFYNSIMSVLVHAFNSYFTKLQTESNATV